MKTGFPAVAGRNAEILVLGTMPGAESLRKRQYYGHPRNAFWFIIGRLLEKDAARLGYAAKKRLLKAKRIALWDVIAACERKGSLDTAIIPGSVKVNDFISFYAAHRGIKRVFFNGAQAEKEYKTRVLPLLPDAVKRIKYARLPSTSPAMARLTRERKLAAWSVLRPSASGGRVVRRRYVRLRRTAASRKENCKKIYGTLLVSQPDFAVVAEAPFFHAAFAEKVRGAAAF